MPHHYIQPGRSYNSVTLVLCAFIFVALLLTPFYILGPDSAVGWYDEYDAIIPWNIIQSKHPGVAFIHEWGGGIGSQQNFLQGNERVSALSLLSNFLSLQLATVFLRALFYLVLITGMYLLIWQVSGIEGFPALFAALFTTVSTPINYGWILSAGSAWLMPFLVWFLLAVISKSSKIKVIATFLAPVICVLIGNPIFMLTCLPIFILGCWGTQVIARSDLPRLILIFSIIIIATALNYYPNIIYYLKYLADESSRFIDFNLDQVWVLNSSVHLLTELLNSLLESKIKLFSSLLTLFCLIILYFQNATRAKLLIRGLLSMFLAYFSLVTLSQLSPNLIFAKFRWDVALIAINIFAGWIVASALNGEPDRSFGRIITKLAVCLVILINSALLLRATFSNLATTGGWSVFNHYEKLRDLARKEENYRVVSAYYTAPPAALASVYGLDAFDGMSPGFSWRRTLYFKNLLQNDYTKPFHTHRQGLMQSLTPAMIQALEIANVGTILSHDDSSQLEDLGLALHSLDQGSFYHLPEFGSLLWKSLGIPNNIFNFVPKLYLWKLPNPWSRVYITNKISISEADLHDHQYWQDLLGIQKESALFAAGEVNPELVENFIGKGAKLISWRKDDQGFEIVTNGLPGVLVINQVYDGIWQVACNVGQAKVFATNGIMMAVFLPENCAQIKVEHRLKPGQG